LSVSKVLRRSVITAVFGIIPILDRRLYMEIGSSTFMMYRRIK
jgi:hypothetical protein